MKYPITLYPSGLIPRDPALSIRMQRETAPVAEAVTVTETLPAPVVSLLLLANFNGIGDLSTYECDTGQTFEAVFANVGSLADLPLDGYGAVESVDGAIFDGIAQASVAPTTPAFKFEALAVFDDAGGAPGAGWNIQMDIYFGTDGIARIFAQSDGAVNLALYDSVGDPLFTDSATIVPYAGRPMLFAIEVTPSGTAFNFNDQAIATTPEVPDALPTHCGYNSRATGAGTGYVDALKFFGVA